jgi:hypothetical protein
MSSLGRSRVVVAIGAFVTCLVACGPFGALGGPHGGAYPGACAQWGYSDRRCEAIVDDAIDAAGLERPEIASIELLPFKRVQTLGGGQVALIRFRLFDGSALEQSVSCVGVSFRPACNDAAEIQTNSGVDHDVPCAGEPPDGCATLPPTPDPDAVAAARPFRLDAIDVKLDHEGPYEVKLGQATLPNGYLSERSLTLADPQPEDYWIDDGVRLDVRPDVAGRPFVGSIYRDPFDGPEPVTIYLVFEVTQLDEPSVLQVRDVVVR